MSKNIRIGLFGCGRISNRHIEAVTATEGVEIAAVCDLQPERARASAARAGAGTKVVECLKQFDDVGVDYLAVLTPSGQHPRDCIEIAERTSVAGIICEKPISLTLRESAELFRRVDATGKRLLPVYQNRYNPLVVLLKDLIDSGRLGHLHQFVCNVFWNRNDAYFTNGWHGTRELDGGVLYTQASHYVDLLHFLFGEVVESKGIDGRLRGLEVPDTISATCSFRSGVVGSLNATVSVYDYNYLTEFTLIGAKGTVRLSGTNLNTIDFWKVQGMDKPDADFKLNHVYGKGHDLMYQYLVAEDWDKFPSRQDVLSGIRLMEQLSY